MGCKCANSLMGEEDKDEITQKRKNDEEGNNNFNMDFHQNNEDLLGLGNQENDFPKGVGQNESLEDKLKNNNNDDPNNKYADYPQKIIELINTIRDDPASYAEVIEDSIKNIVEDENQADPNKPKIIFKKKVKVALTKGEPAFRDAANYLRTLGHLEPLEYNPDICIPLPETEEEMKDPTFLREQVKKIRESTNIDVFFKDLIKIPEVSSLLMIVDDTSKNASKKRLALLNQDLKYIGVTSKFIGKTFIAYFAFSK